MSSHIEMKADRVIELANQKKVYWTEQRKTKIKEAVENRMENRRWWKRWLPWLKEFSFEETEKILIDEIRHERCSFSISFSEYSLARCHGWQDEVECYQIVRLALNSLTGIVHLSQEDFKKIT